MPLFKNRWYVDDDLLETLRNKFLDDIADPAINAKYHEEDIRRVKENDWFLARYILHADKDIDKAYNMLSDSLKFRKDMEVNTVRKKDLPSDYFKVRAVIQYNKDHKGSPIVVIRCKTHIKREDTKRFQQQYMLYWVEKALRSSNWSAVSILFDCTDSGVSNMDIDMIRFLFDTFKKYVPWGLGYFFVYNMPWYMTAFWKVIKQWIPAKHIERICFVDCDSILQYVEKDQLPQSFGGTCTKLYEPREGVVDDGEESE